MENKKIIKGFFIFFTIAVFLQAQDTSYIKITGYEYPHTFLPGQISTVAELIPSEASGTIPRILAITVHLTGTATSDDIDNVILWSPENNNSITSATFNKGLWATLYINPALEPMVWDIRFSVASDANTSHTAGATIYEDDIVPLDMFGYVTIVDWVNNIDIPDQSLPVSLLTVKLSKNSYKFSTASELNSSYYELYIDNKFEYKFDGSGNYSGISNYEYVFPCPLKPGMHVAYLYNYSYDGKVTALDTTTVEVPRSTHIYPNPATTHISNKFKFKTIEIYNVLGQKVRTLKYPNRYLGLTPGVYFIRIDYNKIDKFMIINH